MNLSLEFPAKTLFLIIAFSVVMFFTYPTHGKDWSAAQKEVWKMQEAVWSLWKKGEVEGVLALYHKDCTLWYYNAIFSTGKGYIRQRVNYNQYIKSYELEPQEVKVFDNFAIVLYSLKYTIVHREDNERVMTTWMKQNGKWQIIGSMHSQQRQVSE
jgi:hypothetical protein